MKSNRRQFMKMVGAAMAAVPLLGRAKAETPQLPPEMAKLYHPGLRRLRRREGIAKMLKRQPELQRVSGSFAADGDSINIDMGFIPDCARVGQSEFNFKHMCVTTVSNKTPNPIIGFGKDCFA